MEKVDKVEDSAALPAVRKTSQLAAGKVKAKSQRPSDEVADPLETAPDVEQLKPLFEILIKSTFEERSRSFMDGEFDPNTIRAVASISGRFVSPQLERQIRTRMSKGGWAKAIQDEFCGELRGRQKARFEKYLTEFDDYILEIRAVVLLLKFCRGKELTQAFKQFRPTVEELPTESLASDIFKVTGELITPAMSGDFVSVIRSAAEWARGVIKKPTKRRAYIAAIQDAILFQLNPDHIETGGMRTSDIVDSYRRVDPDGEITPERLVVIYKVVRRLLKQDGVSSLSAPLQDAGLENYARVHARLMELRLALKDKAGI